MGVQQRHQSLPIHQLFSRSLLSMAILAASAAVSAETTAEAKIEKISVTGSHIRKGSFDSPSPITVMDSDDIQGVGAVNIGDFLGKIPAVVGDTTSASANISEQSSGLNTIALRNLGSSRTLVLVDGIRYVSGMSVGAGYGVDLNTIPTSLIDRVEILTGGQSAAYGSDAVAGVINIILKKDFEGVVLKARAGQSSEADRKTRDLELTFGQNFQAGNSWFSLGYSDDEGLMATDRDYSRVHKDAVDTNKDGRLDTPLFVGSSHILGARVGKYKGDGSLYTPTSDVTTSDAFNFHDYRSMLTPLSRMFAASGLNLDINAESRVNLTLNYARVDSRARFEPIPLDTRNDIYLMSRGGSTGISIATHPWFAGSKLGNALLADGITSLDQVSVTFRRLGEFGDRGAENTRSTLRVAADYEYDLSNDLTLNLTSTYGVTDQNQTNHGDINLERARQALAVESNGNGGYQCADIQARLRGCVPFNPFSKDGISAEAVKYLAASTGLVGSIEQFDVSAIVAGDLDMAISKEVTNLAFASGVEYRKEKGQETPDPLREAGIVRGNKIARTKGEFDVVDVFGELHVPVLPQLNLDLAVRFGDYASVGNTSNWTVGLDAPLNDSWRLRGAAATAVRAPNVSDLFAGGTATSAFVTDPCNGITAATPGNIAQNCRSIAAISNRIKTEGAFTLTQVERQNTQGLLSGSTSVKEEKADSLTAGVVFTPENLDGLQVSLDYYNIKIDDAIDKTDRTVILNRCYSVASSAFEPNCGGLVRRDGRTGAALDVNAASGNENIIETQGVDFESSYETTLGAGELYLTIAANYLQQYDITGIATKDVQNLAGEVMFPKKRLNVSTSYTLGDWNMYWQARYWDATKDRNNNKIMTDELNSVPSRIYHDLRLSYQFSPQINSHVGINNLFDVQPPLLTANHKYQQAGTLTNGSAFDLTGRAFYAGVHVTF